MAVLEAVEAVGVRAKVVGLDIRAALGRGVRTLTEEVEDHTTEAQIKQTQLVIKLVEDMSPSRNFKLYVNNRCRVPSRRTCSSQAM
jgi:hypothetical protein